MEFAVTFILFPLLSISLSRHIHMIIGFWITHSSSHNFQYIKYICHLLSYADGFSLKIMTFVTWIWCIWHVQSILNLQNTFQLFECVFYVVRCSLCFSHFVFLLNMKFCMNTKVWNDFCRNDSWWNLVKL